MRSIKNVLITLIVFFITLCMGLGAPAFADTVQFTVGQEVYSFDTGTGADGDVVIRLKPGDPNTAEVVVNGQVKTTTTSTEIIRKNIMELDGRALGLRSDISYKVFNIENITTYLPVNKTYSPSNLTPGSGTMPNFRNLTIGPGVLLRTNNNQAMHFKVKENLIVEGAILSRHGAGGTSAGADGESAPGNVFILADTIIVAPNGTTGEQGAILAGWGGGGGGPVWNNPGHGGNGAGMTIYARQLINQGEIRPGNGGGGSAALYNTWGDGRGNGGTGGDLNIFASEFENYGVVAGSFGGGYGAPGRYGGGFEQYGGGGYGSGGDNQGGAAGGSAGSPSTGYASWISTSGFGGSVGNAGNTKGQGSANNGKLIIKADNVVKWGSLISGYTSGGTGNVRGTEYIQVYTNTFTDNITSSMFFNQVTHEREIYVYSQPLPLSAHTTNIHKLKVTNDLTLNNSTSTITTLETSGNLTVANTSNITINNSNITGNLLLSSNSTLTGNIGTSDFPINSADISGSLGNVAVFSTGSVRFKENNNYKLDNWWTGRTVTVNGLRIRGATQSSATNSTGINEVSLTDWISKYNPGGALPTMRFIVERQPEGELSWTSSSSFDRNLSGTVIWQDIKTVVGETIKYRIGFKIPASALGYIYLENIESECMSEGGGLDETPPQIQLFQVAGGNSTVYQNLVNAKLVATDNRTDKPDLKLKLSVNNDMYRTQGDGTLVSGDLWGVYVESILNIPLSTGVNEIFVFLKDEAGKIGQSVSYVVYGSASNITALEPENAVVQSITPSGNEPSNLINYSGKQTWVVHGNLVNIDLSSGAAPYNAFSADGVTYSEYHPKGQSIEVMLPPGSGLKMLKIRPANAQILGGSPTTYYFLVDGQAPVISSLKTLSGAYATSGNNINLVVEVVDNFSSNLTYDINGGIKQALPANGVISAPVGAGPIVTITVNVYDEANNTSSKVIRIRKI